MDKDAPAGSPSFIVNQKPEVQGIRAQTFTRVTWPIAALVHLLLPSGISLVFQTLEGAGGKGEMAQDEWGFRDSFWGFFGGCNGRSRITTAVPGYPNLHKTSTVVGSPTKDPLSYPYHITSLHALFPRTLLERFLEEIWFFPEHEDILCRTLRRRTLL